MLHRIKFDAVIAKFPEYVGVLKAKAKTLVDQELVNMQKINQRENSQAKSRNSSAEEKVASSGAHKLLDRAEKAGHVQKDDEARVVSLVCIITLLFFEKGFVNHPIYVCR